MRRTGGFVVDVPGFGKIVIDEKRLNTSLDYLDNDADAIAYKAIKPVLKHGKVIADKTNHKGREYGTITFAAPVIINGKRGNMGVVVKRTSKNFYKMHRVLTPDGGVRLDISKKDDAEFTPVGGVTENGSLATTINSASERSIPRTSEESNRKFSLKDPVEETATLVALHNLSAEKLTKALELGGFPMPSIAVTKSDIPHTNFGDITLVMDKSAVDPQADRRNNVYSADAWTPTFPQVEYEVNEKAASKLRSKYYELYRKFGNEATRPLYPWGNYAEDELNRRGGIDGVIEEAMNDADMMKLFLMDKGLDVPAPVTEENVSRLDDDTVAFYDRFINAMGEEAFQDLVTKDGENPLEARKRWWSEHGEAFENVYRDYLSELGFSEEEITNVLNNETMAAQTRKALQMRNYLQNGPETRTTTTNATTTNDAIKAAVDENAYSEWLHSLFDGLVKSSGIYNGRDRYTASGNSRSFSSTHYPVTLENIAKAMAAQNDGNSRNVSGFYGVKSLRAGTAEHFASIKAMHDREGRLRHLSEEEAEQINDSLSDRLTEVMGRIYDKGTHGKDDNMFIAMDNIGEILMEVTEQKHITVDSIEKVFGKYRYDISNPLAADIRDLLFDISEMPVNIFEAKPERAVRFDEVLAAVVPAGTDNALLDGLREHGVGNILTYEKDNDADRLEKVNSVEGSRFSLKGTQDVESARGPGQDAVLAGDRETRYNNSSQNRKGALTDGGFERPPIRNGIREPGRGRSGLAQDNQMDVGQHQGKRTRRSDSGGTGRSGPESHWNDVRYEELSDDEKTEAINQLYPIVADDPIYSAIVGGRLIDDDVMWIYNGIIDKHPVIDDMMREIPGFAETVRSLRRYIAESRIEEANVPEPVNTSGTSQSTDSKGRPISLEQERYFRKSVVRDSKGRLSDTGYDTG